MGKKYEKTSRYLNHVEYLPILVSTVTSCVSFSAFASSVFIPVGITSSAVGKKVGATLQELKSISKL